MLFNYYYPMSKQQNFSQAIFQWHLHTIQTFVQGVSTQVHKFVAKLNFIIYYYIFSMRSLSVKFHFIHYSPCRSQGQDPEYCHQFEQVAKPFKNVTQRYLKMGKNV